MSLETVLAQIAFSKALLHRDRFISAFYKRLFHNQPELRPLFPDDMTTQQVKMVDTLTLLTLHLQDREALMEGLRGLGIRHQGYGVLPSHYEPMRTAMLEALSKVLGTSGRPRWRSRAKERLIGSPKSWYRQRKSVLVRNLPPDERKEKPPSQKATGAYNVRDYTA